MSAGEPLVRSRHHGGMADDLVVTRSWTIPDAELVERFSRSSGPGGQGVNTTDSRVELSFDVASSPSVPAYLRNASSSASPSGWSTASSR